MRPAAQVYEFALAIEAQLRVAREAGFDMLDLEPLVHIFAKRYGILAIERELLKRLGLGDDRCHLLFDFGEVLLGQLLRHQEVVVEAVGDGRTKGQRDLRIEPHDGPSHDMGAGVPEHIERLGIFLGQEFQGDRRAVVKRLQQAGRVDDFSSNLGCNNGFCESRTDRIGDRKWGGIVRMGDNGSIGKLNIKHVKSIVKEWGTSGQTTHLG